MYGVYEIRPGVWHYCTLVTEESGYEHFAVPQSEYTGPQFAGRADAIAESHRLTGPRRRTGRVFPPERNVREFPSWDAGR